MNLAIKIERGIPLPPPANGRPKGELRIAIGAMKPGESFAVPRTVKVERIKSAAKNEGARVAVRKWNCASLRVWRVE